MKQNNKAIFLDRDGVINDLIYYSEEGIVDSPNSVKQFKITSGVFTALKKLKKLGFILLLISNQPGIAKKKYSLLEFKKIQKKMNIELEKNNIQFDAEYYCLHHPNALDLKYKKKCSCRKPNNKMVLDGIKKFNINLDLSYIIGDGLVDMKLAKKIKCRSIYVGNINTSITKLFSQNNIEPTFIVHSLLEASKIIEQESK